MLSIGLSICCLLAGSILTWMIRKLVFEKHFVSIEEYKSLQEQFIDLKTQKALVDQSFNDLKTEVEVHNTKSIDKETELEELKSKLSEKSAQYTIANELLTEAKSAGEITKKDLQEKNGELTSALSMVANLKAQVETKQEKLDTQQSDLESIHKKMEDQFKVLAQTILEDKTKRFSYEQEKNLKGILEPLQKEIQLFKEDIRSKQKQESEERISLREQVKHISTLNQTLSDQANKLTETLRLQVKQQGDWGESILEAILEHSGLQKNLQYFTQHSSKNDEGKTIRPDVTIKYPDDRIVIIDSKVSMVHYYNMCSEADGVAQKDCLKQLIQSIKSHIDGLSSKNYQDISHAMDFIVMFVPVEPAYIAAMYGDSGLWQYAYKKGIYLLSPANLIATLTLVKDMWRKDAVDKNAQEIADKAGKLYDKLVSFVDNFEKVGVQLEKAADTWVYARKQLTHGKGNLISQAIKMNALNINSKKALAEDLTNDAVLNDHFSLE